ncbi:hypothetical protein GTR00_21050, partial [Kineococcus sp. T90]
PAAPPPIAVARPEARWLWALAPEEDVERTSALDAAALARFLPAGGGPGDRAGRAALREEARAGARAVVLRRGVRRWVLAVALTCCPEVVRAHPPGFRQVGPPVEEELARDCQRLLGTARLVLAVAEHWPDPWIGLSHRCGLPAALVRDRLSTPAGLAAEEVLAALRTGAAP